MLRANLQAFEVIFCASTDPPRPMQLNPRRPEIVEDMCYAHWSQMYRSAGKVKEEDDDELVTEDVDDENGPEVDLDDEEDDNAKFHYIQIGRAHV